MNCQVKCAFCGRNWDRVCTSYLTFVKCSFLLETYEPSEQPQQPHPNGSSEKRNGKHQPAQNPPAHPDVLVPLLQSASSLFAQIPPAHLTAPIRVSTPPTFQSTSATGALTVPDSSVQIKQEPASPTHGEENINIPMQSSQCSQPAELQFQDGMLI